MQVQWLYPMQSYIIKRILGAIPVMFVVVVFVFSLLRLAPGDPAVVVAGDYAKPEDIIRIRQKLGLDKPIHEQFVIWMGQILRGDLGTSIFTGLPVAQLIKQRLEPTLSLCIFTLIISTGLAIPLGILAAWKAGTWIDRGTMVFSVLGFSLPVFWLGFLLMYFFSIQLSILPVQGYARLSEGFIPFIKHLILPSLALGMIYTALLARMTRASMLEVLKEDYIRTAFAKGVKPGLVLMRHAFKNASLPVATIIGTGFALLLGGAVVTESVFAIPGLGRLTVDAILHRDYPVIQGVILFTSSIYVFINLLVDLSYVFLDPRIRY
ncbi:MAG TPA: ABC transporter permease [Candidatus Limnocylindrales bacterium]|nr:ABC transporter permease [Candidatus Limnocylindrales bacterium]